MECIKYGDLSFQSDFTCAVNTQLEKIKFSKYERALLKEFTHKPNRLLSREHLLNAISTLGSDAVDRNIDYLICRLRRKLNDTPRALLICYP